VRRYTRKSENFGRSAPRRASRKPSARVPKSDQPQPRWEEVLYDLKRMAILNCYHKKRAEFRTSFRAHRDALHEKQRALTKFKADFKLRWSGESFMESMMLDQCSTLEKEIKVLRSHQPKFRFHSTLLILQELKAGLQRLEGKPKPPALASVSLLESNFHSHSFPSDLSSLSVSLSSRPILSNSVSLPSLLGCSSLTKSPTQVRSSSNQRRSPELREASGELARHPFPSLPRSLTTSPTRSILRRSQSPRSPHSLAHHASFRTRSQMVDSRFQLTQHSSVLASSFPPIRLTRLLPSTSGNAF
jgi:hypothetical protein